MIDQLHPKFLIIKKSLQEIDFDDIKAKPPSCSCNNSKFCYLPVGHIITGDLNIIENETLRSVIYKGPKYRVPKTINWKYNFKLLMDAVEDYARKWAKREDANINSLSEWIKIIRDKIKHRISKLKHHMKFKIKCIFKDEDVLKCLTSLQQKYVIVPADKASNNVVFVCKSYYISCLLRELDKSENSNKTYTPTTFSKGEIINNQLSVLSSFGISVKEEDHQLPSMYWLPKLHKTPYKERYIASSYKCSTKELQFD